MEENCRHQFSIVNLLISATHSLPNTSKYQLWPPKTDAILVRVRAHRRYRVGSTTAAWGSSLPLVLWRKIVVISFRSTICWFRLLIHYHIPPKTDAILVRVRAYRRFRVGSITVVQNSCLLVELWRKIAVISFRPNFPRFWTVLHSRGPPETSDLGLCDPDFV